MATPLHDGHFMVLDFSPQEARVNARFPEGYEDEANPALIFYLNDWSGDKDADPPPNHKNWNFAEDLIISKYLTGGGNWAKSDNGLRIAQGKIYMTDEEPKEHIAYLYFSEFYLVQTMANETAEKKPVTGVLNAFWTNLHSDQCKGIIFDVRGNIGGYNSDIEYLIRPLLTEKLHFANLRTKKNESRLSYTPWIPYTINPNNPIGNAGKIPVVALINDYSVSCGELLPLAVRAMPNGYLIGTRTYGATGPRIGDDYPNALNDGGFTVRWSSGYSFSVTQAGYQTRGKNFENYEGIGIEPDERVPFSRKKFTNNGNYDAAGCDGQLKAAIEYITKWPAD
jgi:C-terminal processing protease CtpA/Prc